MPRTILQLINATEDELGLERSATVYGTSPTLTAKQMGALANRALDELRRMNRWTVMQFEFNIVVEVPLVTTGTMAAGSAVITAIPSTSTLEARFWSVSGTGVPDAARISTIDSATQVTMNMQNTNTAVATATAITFAKDTYSVPSGFDYFNNETMWDRTNFWQLLGPTSPQVDQYLRSGITPTGPRRHWRYIGPYANKFRLWPPPTEITTPLQLVFEYLSLNAVSVNGAGNAFAQLFANDNDTCLLDENALMMGIKWMFWEIKGFGSYITMQNRWIDYVNRLAARDGGAKTLNMARRPASILISSANAPDGNFPSS